MDLIQARIDDSIWLNIRQTIVKITASAFALIHV
jgi:hypothetical protein